MIINKDNTPNSKPAGHCPPMAVRKVAQPEFIPSKEEQQLIELLASILVDATMREPGNPLSPDNPDQEKSRPEPA